MQGIQDALDADSAALDSILSKAIAAYKAAEAARKARELVRRKSVLTRSALPGKLADCSSTDAASSEIFIVEGDSAGIASFPGPSRTQSKTGCNKLCPAVSRADDSRSSNLYNMRPSDDARSSCHGVDPLMPST